MADPFPFSDTEWDRVKHSQTRRDLFRILEELRRKYGDHPVLLETEADFTKDKRRRRALYEQAIQAALAGGLDTFSIRTAFAWDLIWDFGEREQARKELLACEHELARADDSDREFWQSALAECSAESECES